ncbi:hypothetical protein [Faecalibacillus intestinalis]|jgi:hypothetical protein|uniref:hypothetical protein n=1 Tax=Faecalibacillus intestinalis TaxID=1982626 RepID=UPI0022E221DD|nr:hypothetical protein [Faecalibacillus intestinalis]
MEQKIDPMWIDFINYLKKGDVDGLNHLNNIVQSRMNLYKNSNINSPWVIQISLLNYVLINILEK